MSDLAKLQQELFPRIESYLHSTLDGIDFSRSSGLGEMLTYHMGWGTFGKTNPVSGKRIRPLLTLLCHGAFNDDPEPALPGAAAVEFLHNFTLIHDDIEDCSPLRHGQPTLWKKWGLAQAINAGDALFSIAQMTILSLEQTCNLHIAQQAAGGMNSVCLHLTSGQYLDIAFETASDVSIETYLEMVEGKTAALIAFAASLGGLTAGQTRSIQSQLSDFGKQLGLAFQIQDDALGIWGHPDITGKSAATDLKTKKKSLPVLFGLAHSPEFQSVWEKENPSDTDVDEMAALLETCGARGHVTQAAKNHADLAIRTLNGLFPQHNRFSNALFELTDLLLYRSA